MILQQICSENYSPNFIGVARVLLKILQKTFGLFFGRTVYYVKHIKYLIHDKYQELAKQTSSNRCF